MATAIICLLLIVAVIFGIKSYARKLRSGCCGASSEPSVKKVRVHDKDVSHYPYHKELKVDGMSCGNCANRVENALNSLDGVWARVDLSEGSADVRLKEPISDQTLKQAVKRAGYIVYRITDI